MKRDYHNLCSKRIGTTLVLATVYDTAAMCTQLESEVGPERKEIDKKVLSRSESYDLFFVCVSGFKSALTDYTCLRKS